MVPLVALRIGNDNSYARQLNDEIHVAWQAQYLVKLECDLSWQAQHFVTFWDIAGARNVVFFNTKSSSRSDREGLRSGGCEMTILSSDIVGMWSNRLSFRECNQSGMFPRNLDLRISGRRSTW